VGFEYIRLKGSGVDYVRGNQRGTYLDDGVEFPMVSTLYLNNYLIISRHMDLEANINVSYSYFPMKTQEDELRVNLTEEGVFGTFSSEFHPSRDTRLLLYDDILYRTDYVDTRGLSDSYGGEAYEHFENTVGADWDWQPSPFDSFSMSGSRTDVIVLDDTFQDQERVAYAEAASYQRALTRFAAAGLLGNFQQSLYDSELRPDIYLYGLSAFTAAQLTRRLTGNASLGYQYSTYVGGASDGESRGSLSGSLGLGHEISETKNQRLTYQRTQSEAFNGGIDVSDTIGYGLFWHGGQLPGSLSTQYASYSPQDAARSGYSDWATTLAMQHQLTRLLRLNLSTSYAMRFNDPGEGLIDGSAPDISSDYETWSIRLGTGMKLTKKTRFSTYAEHAARTSESENLAYTRDIIGAFLTWSHKF